jgi:hypothetical protein
MYDVASLVLGLNAILNDGLTISFKQFLTFIEICAHLRPLIQFQSKQGNTELPPLWLEANVQHFLADSMSSIAGPVSCEAVATLWKHFGPTIWDLGHREGPKSLLPLFLTYGTSHHIGELTLDQLLAHSLIHEGFATILPPVTTCTRVACQSRKLTRCKDYSATLFTLDNGPIPVFPLSQRCPSKLLFEFEVSLIISRLQNTLL